MAQPLNTKPWGQFLLSLPKNDHEERARIWNGYQRYLYEKEQAARKLDGREPMDEPASLKEALLNAPILHQNEIALMVHRPSPVFSKLFDDNVNRVGFKEVTSVDFENIAGIDFEGLNFTTPVESNFKGFLFAFPLYFNVATFAESAHFAEATFCKDACFIEATFSKKANFHKANFFGHAVFLNVKFYDSAHFNKAGFSGAGFFIDAIFSETAHFLNTRFDWGVSFIRSKFKAGCDFTFTQREAPASIIYLDQAEFKAHPPELYDRPLNTASSWNDMILPPMPTEISDINRHQKAYVRLRILANGLGKVSDEHKFFRKEMDCKLAEAKRMMFGRTEPKKTWEEKLCLLRQWFLQLPSRLKQWFLRLWRHLIQMRPWKWQLHHLRQWFSQLRSRLKQWLLRPWRYLRQMPFWKWQWRHSPSVMGYGSYKIFSGYGHSILIPAGWLLGVWYLGLLGWYCQLAKTGATSNFKSYDSTLSLIADAAGHSLASLIPIFRFIKPDSDFWQKTSGWFVAVVGLQGALGLIFLFLIGLAIRNILRLR